MHNSLRFSLKICKFYTKIGLKCLIGVSNVKEIDPWKGGFWLAQSYLCKTVRRRKSKTWGNFQEHISRELTTMSISFRFGM